MAVAEEYFDEKEAAEIKAILRKKVTLRDVRRAVMFYKISRGSFSGTRTSFGVKKNNILSFRYQIQRASERLQNVVIERC